MSWIKIIRCNSKIFSQEKWLGMDLNPRSRVNEARVIPIQHSQTPIYWNSLFWFASGTSHTVAGSPPSNTISFTPSKINSLLILTPSFNFIPCHIMGDLMKMRRIFEVLWSIRLIFQLKIWIHPTKVVCYHHFMDILSLEISHCPLYVFILLELISMHLFRLWPAERLLTTSGPWARQAPLFFSAFQAIDMTWKGPGRPGVNLPASEPEV